MIVNKSLIALLALAAPLFAASAQPTGTETPSTEAPPEPATPSAGRTERPAPAERRICRRIDTTGSRTAGQRVCMTAEQWRRAQY